MRPTNGIALIERMALAAMGFACVVGRQGLAAQRVFARSYGLQVSGSNAIPVSAASLFNVVDLHPCRNEADLMLVHPTMRVGVTKHSVTAGVYPANPKPAFAGLVDLRPKAFCGWPPLIITSHRETSPFGDMQPDGDTSRLPLFYQMATP